MSVSMSGQTMTSEPEGWHHDDVGTVSSSSRTQSSLINRTQHSTPSYRYSLAIETYFVLMVGTQNRKSKNSAILLELPRDQDSNPKPIILLHPQANSRPSNLSTSKTTTMMMTMQPPSCSSNSQSISYPGDERVSIRPQQHVESHADISTTSTRSRGARLDVRPPPPPLSSQQEAPEFVSSSSNSQQRQEQRGNFLLLVKILLRVLSQADEGGITHQVQELLRHELHHGEHWDLALLEAELWLLIGEDYWNRAVALRSHYRRRLRQVSSQSQSSLSSPLPQRIVEL